MALHPRLGGVWMAEITEAFGSVQRSFGEHGCLEASFSYYLPVGSKHPALRRGSLLELLDSGGVDWSGIVTEIADGQVHARGYAAEASRYQAKTALGAATSNPRTAGNTAVSLGWNVTIDSSIPNANMTTVANSTNTVAALYEAQALELAKYFSVDENRVARMSAAPTTPSWQIPPGVVDLGQVDDNYASAFVVTYQSGASTTAQVTVVDQAAADLFGYSEETLDLTSLGVMTSTRATTFGNALVTLGRSKLGWSSGFTISRYNLQTLGCRPADLRLVRSLQVVRIHGIDEERQTLFGRPYLDCLIGEASWVDGAPVITLSPLGAVGKQASDVVADLAARLPKKAA